MTMKKRMLALVLALTIVVGLGGQAWAEVLPAVASPSPEVSTQPEESATPEVSETPTESVAPEESAAPAESETPQESAAPAESETPEESTAPEEETDEAPVETPILDEPYALPGVEDFAVTEAAPEVEPLAVTEWQLADHIVGDTVSPSNVQIDLFDYAVMTKESGHPVDNRGDINGNGSYYLQFGNEMGEKRESINSWTGKSTDKLGGPLSSIVQNTLQDGYPVLTAGKSYNATGGVTTAQSLAYLFDQTQVSGKQGYYDVGGLLQVDDKGLMSYDSQQNFAEYDETTNSFVLYDTEAVSANPNDVADVQNGQFFPFNSGTLVFNEDGYGNLSSAVNSSNTNLNHYFGMHMKAYFMQPTGGITASGDNMIFTFSGDDDVWVFIDGVLIGDVGGCHDRLELSINFASGAVQVKNGASYDGNTVFTSTTIRQMVENAHAEGKIQLSGNTLADGTYHTLDFFYLERGGGNSNLRLSTNLVEIPSSSVIKVDQLGNAIPNVGFDLYATDENYTVSNVDTPIASGQTDRSGNLVLTDVNTGVPLNFADLASKKQTYFVLQETNTPDGYRPTEAIQLRYQTLGEHNQGVLLSSNAWSTGSWAASTMTVSLPTSTPIVGVSSSDSYQLEEDGSTRLFAVVLKRQNTGSNPTASDNWYSITGDILNGWELSKTPLTDANQIPLEARHYFTWDTTTKMYDLEINPLPGDITKYYYMLGSTEKANTVYTVGYYIEQGEYVYRINGDSFPRQYAVNAYVTNVKNFLHVQKVDDAGNPVTGATFKLYQEGNISVNPDRTYSIQGVAYDTVTTAKQGSLINLSGLASFPSDGKLLVKGTYYLVESDAPEGYVLNKQAVKIIVDDTGVYADAGESGDGIQVMAGVGSLVDSMAQFGTGTTEGLDRTLADIKAVLGTSNNGVDWAQSTESTIGTDLLYLSRSGTAALQYAATSGVTEQNGQNRFITDTGWIRVNAIYQNYNQVGASTTNKTNLLEQDVNKLFTHTTIVRVKNDRTGLTITKQVEGGTVTETDVGSVAYQFRVEKLNGETVDSSFNDSVQVKVGETTTTETFQSGILTVERNGVGDIQLLLLPNGDYRVTEITTDTDGKVNMENVTDTEKNVTNVWESVTYQNGTSGAASNIPVTVTLSDAQPSAKVTATNHYGAYKTLTVTKTVGGNMGDTTKSFNFTLTVSKDGQYYTQALTETKTETGVEEPIDTEPLTVSQGSNSYSFTLTDDQQIAIQIPYGYTATVTETVVDGYTTTWRSYTTGTEVTETNPQFTSGVATREITMTTNYTVDYRNVLEMATPSGVDTPTTGISVMMGVAAASAVIIFGCSFLMWRRRRRDWM